MTSTTAKCKVLQDQEWEALQSTYPEFLPTEQPQYGHEFILQVAVQLSEPVQVQVQEDNDTETMHRVNISHLPPLSLNVLLPPTYPLQQPPVLHALQSRHDWLPVELIETLKHTLLDMWNNEHVLGLWMEHIQNGEEFLSSLNIFQPSEPSPKFIQLKNPDPVILLLALSKYNASVLEAQFRVSTHTCPICLNRLPGTKCISLSSCAHVACRSCLADFWSSCISEGEVTRVGCPDPECVRCSRQASMTDVQEIVSPEMVSRWQWLLQKQEMERDPTTVRCPITSCQRLIKCPPPFKDGDSSEWDRLRTCECGFAFCMYCRRAWHGPHTSCALLTTEEFVKVYVQHAEGSPERLVIEQRHGRNNVLKLVAKFHEEQLNRSWMDKKTMRCPGCHIRVQKIMGCNHMTCSKCRQHFCYRCGSRLNQSEPYRHFNTPGQPCFSKLFDRSPEEEDIWIAPEDLDPR
ncbi:hypothetical protein K439DRAFT_1325929 [Ramaria rubella]|nr:hypothetical protein K439DRAFT_1325929 [Ramaria rubella]